MPWSDVIPNTPPQAKMFIPELQCPTSESQASPTLSRLEAIASSWRNDTSGVSEIRAASQPSAWTYSASAQEGVTSQGYIFPEDIYEDLERFARDRELENCTDQTFVPSELREANSSDSNHPGFTSKHKATEELLGAYDLEHEHARYAFNVLGLNDMHFDYKDPDIYFSMLH
jgi:hypothetical protein